jgi:8-amino-7-oxononanoate synthase
VHTPEQLQHMVEVMTGIGRQLGVIDDRTRRVVGGAR